MSTIPIKSAELLYQVINNSFVLTQQLNLHLQSERDSIAQRDFEKHKKVLEDKLECIKKLDQTENQLLLLLKKFGIKNQDPNQIDSLIAICPNNLEPLINKSWKALKAELAECKRLNSINSHIIHHAKGHVEKLLSIIKGQDQQSNLYRADGKKHLHSAQRSIARA